MPVTFAEDATGEEAKADVTRVTPDEKDGSARCETVKKVATELTKPSEKYQATAATELCGLPDRCCADSPTTEQPRATNFDSVPSIPSDLF